MIMPLVFILMSGGFILAGIGTGRDWIIMGALMANFAAVLTLWRATQPNSQSQDSHCKRVSTPEPKL